MNRFPCGNPRCFESFITKDARDRHQIRPHICCTCGWAGVVSIAAHIAHREAKHFDTTCCSLEVNDLFGLSGVRRGRRRND